MHNLNLHLFPMKNFLSTTLDSKKYIFYPT